MSDSSLNLPQIYDPEFSYSRGDGVLHNFIYYTAIDDVPKGIIPGTKASKKHWDILEYMDNIIVPITCKTVRKGTGYDRNNFLFIDRRHDASKCIFNLSQNSFIPEKNLNQYGEDCINVWSLREEERHDPTMLLSSVGIAVILKASATYLKTDESEPVFQAIASVGDVTSLIFSLMSVALVLKMIARSFFKRRLSKEWRSQRKEIREKL
jgi:hypothetical protein